MPVNFTSFFPKRTISTNLSSHKHFLSLILLSLLCFNSFGQVYKAWTPSSTSDLSWSTASNWAPEGVPDNGSQVHIAYTDLGDTGPVIESGTSAFAYSIRIANSKTLTITNSTLEVEHEIVVDSNKLIIEDNSEVSCNDDFTLSFFKEFTISESTLDIGGQLISYGIITVNESEISAGSINFGAYINVSTFTNNSKLVSDSSFANSGEMTFSSSNIEADELKTYYNSTNTFSGNSTIKIENDLYSNGIFEMNDTSEIETNNLEMEYYNDRNVWNLHNESCLIVNEKLTTRYALTLYDNSSLIQTSTNDLNSDTDNGKADLKIYRTAKNIEDTDYVYWSSPVKDKSITDIGNDDYRYKWQARTNTGYASNFGNWIQTTEDMETGKGYIVKGGPTGHTSGDDYEVLFSMRLNYGNRLNNGTITTDIKRGSYTGADYFGPSTETVVTSDDDNLNLIGNPYPSAISAKEFLNENTDLDGNVRIWTHTNGLSNTNDDPFFANETQSYNASDYITYNSTGSSTGPNSYSGYIATGQAFFVTLNDSGAKNDVATFTNAMRTKTTDYTNAEFYRTNESLQKSRIWLNLTADETKTSTTMLLGYVDGATEKRDRLYDAIPMNVNTMGLYSLIDDKPMVIQGRSLPFEAADEVPLKLITTTKDLYTIDIKSVDGVFDDGQDVYLEDLYENKIQNLKKSNYTFSAEAGSFDDRFVLRYQNNTSSIEDAIIADSNFAIIATKNFIKASTSTNTIDTIVVYDVLGRVIYQANKLNTTEVKLDQLKPTNSPLIVRATLTNGTTKTQKVKY